MKLRLRKLNQRGFDHMLLVVFVVVFGGIGGTYYVLSHANPWSGGLKINNGSNLCLENMDNSKTPYTTVQAVTCNGNSQAQHWSRKDVPGSSTNFQLVAATSGACIIDSAGAVQTKPGVDYRVYLETWGCNSSDLTQVWHWGGTGNHQLVNAKSGGCINYPTGNNSVQRTIVYSCSASIGGSGGNAQWLEVGNSASGTTTTTSGSSSGSASSTGSSTKVVITKSTVTHTNPVVALQLPITNPAGYHVCLDNKGGKVFNANNNPVEVWQCNGTVAQTWFYGQNSQKQYVLAPNNNHNYCLAANQNLSANGTPVRLYSCNLSSGQHWKAVNKTINGVAGGVEFVNTPGSGKCLDDSGFSVTNGTPLELYTCNGGANQVFFPVIPSTSSKK